MAIFGRGRKTHAAASPAAGTPTVSELNQAEQDWLQGLLAELASAGVAPDDLAGLQRHYDDSYLRWAGLPEDAREDANAIINRVGAGLGQHLAARTGLSWVIATDEYGTELALHGQPGDVVIFPPNMIGKRWAEGETGFLVGLADSTAQRVAELRQPR